MSGTATASVVRVTTLGGQVKEEAYVEGNTAAYYLGKTGSQLGGKATLSINGNPATAQDPVPEGAVLIVAPKIANG